MIAPSSRLGFVASTQSRRRVCYCGDIPFIYQYDRLYISLLIKLWQDAIAQEKLLFRHQDML
ncbi:MAG: hypothetical protein EWV53_18790 [Microcystis panniformis Mp_MB_F_20051200_S9]|uniref:Uncharacterized protein n=1 Tax=Microcystis panniformis Mp_MB_F_20051200_S9 TaxID=2486223 RepID=A0A552PN73_9CHRO|nr:MAG: hypothetical protein EWV42_01900 [Microcystis panniformis Mp_GB_SS_20050300_S99D]TRV57964.1 MAG: hypothetical protein EWV69_14935 [Microcystis panniformis Mp_MB_F_20080800_S26]TRV58438.1 MAG: hypothetical protein EWV53_18790 [Microcystis panniformis Mp_MB_F_20051200_S9]TRV67186.1 MAG: hypothetical protein EWV86_05010 [Microcystis panniformis Mp_MB_F_20051200_S9D]TRV70212.1 MAG: hypothetical protein EWV51_17025 [Microcystis panniformis Mp_MB_F_20051200_S6]